MQPLPTQAPSPSSSPFPQRRSPSIEDERQALLKQGEEVLKSCGCNGSLSVIVFGASGDLAMKKTFPALYQLFATGLLPRWTLFIGYARSPMSPEEFRTRTTSAWKNTDPEKLSAFKARLFYFHGQYDSAEDLRKVSEELTHLEVSPCSPPCNRIFYLALPPQVFIPALAAIKAGALTTQGYNRVIIEKPFGHDLASSSELSARVAGLFGEEDVYRIDHYLGKEMVQNLFVLRFANLFLQPLWNRNYIRSVLLTFKEPIGTEGRAGYFDSFGIIRDVIQNHLMQILSLVAMERPVSREAEHIRDEKVRVLRCISPATLANTVVGQFVGNPATGKKGYKEEPGVPADSVCPTFAQTVLYINNDRWDGVPFVLKAGKALNERKTEIRIQFHDVPGQLFAHDGAATPRNELVVRVQPNEAIYFKVLGKQPGLVSQTMQTELDLSYQSRYKHITLPEAYERLIYDVVRGDHSHFVRSDELAEAWRIFTPLLHQLESERVQPLPYVFGSRGPERADELTRKMGYTRYTGYDWSSTATSPAHKSG